MTTFMLQGVSDKVSGKLCAPRLVIEGATHVLVVAGFDMS